MNLVVTGSRGFLGTNFRNRVTGPVHSVIEVTRDDDWSQIAAKLRDADAVFHFAGVNRVSHEAEYVAGNAQLTERLCEAMAGCATPPPIVFASSAQVGVVDNAYARSKLAAEQSVADYARTTGARASISRLPNLFGAWGRPNYNSVVATYCFNTSHRLPIEIREPGRVLELAHVDDAVDCLVASATGAGSGAGAGAGAGADGTVGWVTVRPTYRIRLDHLATVIEGFAAMRIRAPDGMDRALLARLRATYDWYAANSHVFDG